jgi:NAD/NADP transhydrogenase alpha subunit
MAKLIMAAFVNRSDADEAITELEQADVPGSDFSLIAQESRSVQSPLHSAEDLATAGGVVGGLAGLTLGAITTAGMLVAGPAALLAGLGWIALTATAGGVVGALVGLGIPEHIARQHESIVSAGGVLIGVEDTEVSESEIRDCFGSHEAKHIIIIEHDIIGARLVAAET